MSKLSDKVLVCLALQQVQKLLSISKELECIDRSYLEEMRAKLIEKEEALY